jgi:selenocysteine-specific elongation factor
MPVIGTAGHVDHGKSTLIQALTGRDPDRLAEEKRRGLTIELGFAWTSIDGIDIGFVDVPGHERFIKNMLAGIEAVHGVLFVVACDEGWMPQSEEHLAIIDLLDQRNGVIALSRRDLVDDDTAELARLEVEERLEGTSLQGAPIVEVAPLSGLGLDLLRSELARLAAMPMPASPRTRLWVDRSFSIAGSGTVVTGTLAGGDIAVGDELEVWPGPRRARVRSLQSHERSVDVAVPGSRTAVNLSGVDAADIVRGAMVGKPGEWLATTTFLADVRPARGMDDALTDRGAFHLHAGSGAWPVRLRMIGGGAALVHLSEPVTLAVGDRIILREVGRRAVVGGGRVLDPAPHRGRQQPATVALLRSSLGLSATDRANALVTARRRADVSAVTAHAGAAPQGFVTVAGRAFSDEEGAAVRQAAAELVAEYHEANPLRPGMPIASLSGQLRLTVDELAALVEGALVIDASNVRLSSFSGDLDAHQQEALEAVQAILHEAGLAAPRASQLGIDLELRHAMERRGELVRIDDDLAYLPEHIDQIKGVVASLGDGFTVAEFRDACGMSRRQAVPVLEWLDRQGVTERSGDVRRVKR